MNIQSRTVTSRRVSRRRQKGSGAGRGALYLILYLLLTAVTVFSIANYRIDLNRRLTDLKRRTDNVKAEIAELELDIQRLKIDRARLCKRDYVLRQVARYNLRLRDSEPYQRRHLTVRSRENGVPRRTASGAAPLRELDYGTQLSLNRQ